MINEPVNKTLYMKIKKEVYKAHPKHSAYRSGLAKSRITGNNSLSFTLNGFF